MRQHSLPLYVYVHADDTIMCHQVSLAYFELDADGTQQGHIRLYLKLTFGVHQVSLASFELDADGTKVRAHLLVFDFLFMKD